MSGGDGCEKGEICDSCCTNWRRRKVEMTWPEWLANRRSLNEEGADPRQCGGVSGAGVGGSEFPLLDKEATEALAGRGIAVKEETVG